MNHLPVQAHDPYYSENTTAIVCLSHCNSKSAYHSLLSNAIPAIERGPCFPQEFIVARECLIIGRDERQDHAQCFAHKAIEEEMIPQYMMFTGQYYEHPIEHCFMQESIS